MFSSTSHPCGPILRRFTVCSSQEGYSGASTRVSLTVLCVHNTPWQQYLITLPHSHRYNPSWFSARGHHIQKGMVQDWEAWFLSEGHDECRDIEYEDDGRTVCAVLGGFVLLALWCMCTAILTFSQWYTQMPHWGHLYLTEEELKAHLRTTPLGKCERMVQQFADWLFRYDLVWGTNKVCCVCMVCTFLLMLSCLWSPNHETDPLPRSAGHLEGYRHVANQRVHVLR